MKVCEAAMIERSIGIKELIEALRTAFGSRYHSCPRHILDFPPAGSNEGSMLVMPAFDSIGGIVKLVTVLPANTKAGLAAIQGVVVALSAEGTPIAVLDGPTVTKLRTGAASALASTYLSRAESVTLTIVGTGALAPHMARAHSSVRPIRKINVWGRDPAKRCSTVNLIRSALSHDVEVVEAAILEDAVAEADIVSCATNSAQPLVRGDWLKAGTFVDLVGSFSPDRREVDDRTVKRSRVFVDTLEGALSEAGDLLIPLRNGEIDQSHVRGDLADLVTGRLVGRSSKDDITLFKSVGCGLEDLVTARLLLSEMGAGNAH